MVPESNAASPLDIPSIKAKITTQEVVDIIREAGTQLIEGIWDGNSYGMIHNPRIERNGVFYRPRN